MTPMGFQAGPASSPEPEATVEKQRRIEDEGKEIAEARTSVAAGYYVTSAEVKAWIDSLATDRPLPAPYPTQTRPR